MSLALEESTILEEFTLDHEKHYEIVDGQPQEKEMAGARHGGIAARLIIRLGGFIEANNLGGVYDSSTSFQLDSGENSGETRMPDISFVAAERIPEEGEPASKWLIAPDLAIEIISPTDLWAKVEGKIRAYFAANVRQVWVVSPDYRSVTVYRGPGRITLFTETDELISEDLLPGFRCPLREIFRSPQRNPAA